MIRTEDEYRTAQQRLDQEQAILRSRAFTDDEQHSFNALVADIERYKASATGPAAIPSLPASPAAPPPPSPPSTPADARGLVVGSAEHGADNYRRQYAAAHPSSVIAAELRHKAMAGDGSVAQASMRREIARAGIIPASG